MVHSLAHSPLLLADSFQVVLSALIPIILQRGLLPLGGFPMDDEEGWPWVKALVHGVWVGSGRQRTHETSVRGRKDKGSRQKICETWAQRGGDALSLETTKVRLDQSLST